jgi:CHAT domain-containing protein
MHRALDGGWYFVVLSDHMAWVHTPIHEPEAAAEDALARLVAAGAFNDVTQLAIAPVDEMNGVELDRLAPVEQLALPVVYELGLARSARIPELRRDAAVVVGASGLRRAHTEADFVASRLEQGGWRIDRSWDPGAERQPILLHFAGHGLHEGLAGWGSRLTLADERELSSAELLAIGRAPDLVVLGACEAAAREPDAIDGGMNMATAFLLAGAELVIAPDQPVDDRVSEAFALALHREPLPTGPGRRTALLAALWRVQREDPRFAVWRAWVP